MGPPYLILLRLCRVRNERGLKVKAGLAPWLPLSRGRLLRRACRSARPNHASLKGGPEAWASAWDRAPGTNSEGHF